jgi:hypothetical protein
MKMQLRRRLRSGTHDDKRIEESQRGADRTVQEALVTGKTWGEIKITQQEACEIATIY